MLLLVAAVASAVGRPSPASGDCVSALRYPNEPAFDVCRTGETVCWLYLSEKPFIAVDPLVNASVDAARRRPHRCADHSAYGVAGSSFSILKVVSLADRMTAAPEPDHMCVFAGKPDECSFNQVVEFIDASGTDTSHRAYGLVLGVHGALLFTPERASVGRWLEPIFREEMVIVRRAGTDSSVQLDLANAWFPFTQPAWLLLLRAVSALLAVTLVLSVARPEPLWGPAWKKNRKVRRGRLSLLRLVAMYLLNIIHNTTGGVPPGFQSPTAMAFEPARRALRAAHLCLLAVGLLYYEAAIIVQHQHPPLSKRVADRSDAEVCSFSVLGSSALARSFAAVMAEARNQTDGGASIAADPYWINAPTVSDSFVHVVHGVANNRTKCQATGATADYLVTFASIAAGTFAEKPQLCKQLEVATTAEVENDFNAGWMLSAAGVNAGPASRTPAGDALRRFAGYIDRDLRLEMRVRSVLKQGGDLLKGMCGRNQPQVQATQLAAPLALAVGIPTAFAVALALVYPALLSLLGNKGGGVQTDRADQMGSGVRSPDTAPDNDGGGDGADGKLRRPRRRLRSRRRRSHHSNASDIVGSTWAPPDVWDSAAVAVDVDAETGATAPAN